MTADSGADDLGAARVFGRDLEVSLRAWARSPLLPIVSIIFGVIQGFSGGSGEVPAEFILLFAFLLVSAGWVGTQRIWYLRTWRDKSFSASEVFKFTVRFISRHVRLGLMMFAILFPFMIVVFAISREPSTIVIVLSVLIVGIDFVLTFVTPALAYSTASASEALRIGMGTLRETWPRCALYALVPPLAFGAAGQLLPDSVLSTSVRIVYLAVVALVGLLFKGAAAAFYLRHYDVGDDGSALMTPSEPRDTSITPAQPERPL